MQIISAIYDKKDNSIGRPIFQKSKEEAIQGLKDALNSTNAMGDYLMPTHRQHPEDYKLIQLGVLEDDAKEKWKIDDNGLLKKQTTLDNPFIKVDEKDIIEFTAIELKDAENKVSAEMIYNLVKKQNDETVEHLQAILTKFGEKINEIKTKIKKRWIL